jgi:predicted ester cyclase
MSKKPLVAEYWRALDAVNVISDASAFETFLSPTVHCHAHQPLGELAGAQSVYQQLWQPLIQSFANLQRETFLMLEGVSNGRIDGNIELDGKYWVTGTGVFHGCFVEDYCGIRATGDEVQLRWGEFCRLEHDVIVELYFLIDLIDLLEQCGVTVLPASRGAPCIYRPPATMDGVVDYTINDNESAYSLRHIRQFIFDGLNAYDQNALQSMGMADYFHPRVQWYGPGGIGHCDGFHEFETLHQQPWLQAFPDRRVQDLDALIAEGAYSAAPGWSGVIATHQGEYLSYSPTGRTIQINGMDWWKRDAEQYVENWVFVDMVHLFKQFGVNLLEQVN